MIEKGIQDGDILIVDKSLEAKNNSVVIAYIDGEFTVKRFVKKKDKVILYPANSNYKPIKITPDNDFLVWGVVTYVLHSCI
jgi:DNA polymerase V